MTEIHERTLRELAEPSEDIHETYTERFQTIYEAFEDGLAVRLEMPTGGDYVYYRTAADTYRVLIETRRRGRSVHDYETFSNSLILWVWCADALEPIAVQDTALWHAAQRLRDPRYTFKG